MRKKIIMLLSCVLLAAVAGMWLRHDAPEYGNGYSEEQRKLWNDRMALYPAAWMMRRSDFFGQEHICTITSMDASEVELVLKQKKQRDLELEGQQKKLRDRENLSLKTESNVKTDSVFLPPDQIPVGECLERARGGDADSSLMMAFHMGWNEEKNSFLSTWNSFREVTCWLERAKEQGRQGARFLKHFFAMMLRENLGSLFITHYGLLMSQDRPCPDYTCLPGYSDFRKSLQGGDILAYLLMYKIAGSHILPPHEKALLQEGLRKQVKAGNVRAMEKMAYLVFGFHLSRPVWSRIDEDMDAAFWNRVVLYFPRNVQSPGKRQLMRLGVLDVEDIAAMREFREGAACARDAARHGSLAGMNYWLQGGISVLEYCSREDWEEIFRYFRILIERKYVPFIRRWHSAFPGMQLDRLLMECYYSSRTLKETVTRLTEGLNERKSSDFKFPVGKTPEEVRRKLDELIALHGVDFILQKILNSRGCYDVSPEIAGVYVSLVRKQADAGDPLGKIVLGFLYEYGHLGVERDPGRSWTCYSEAKNSIGLFGFEPVCYTDPANNEKLSVDYLRNLPSLFMLSLGIRYTDFPERDESMMHALSLELAQCESQKRSTNAGYINYLLGRVHEVGIGALPDRTKALEYYSRGKGRHAGCAKGWEHLYRSDTAGKAGSSGQ